ncbi:hypothetical protein CSUI_008543, partial [Cystoisospora suis]
FFFFFYLSSIHELSIVIETNRKDVLLVDPSLFLSFSFLYPLSPFFLSATVSICLSFIGASSLSFIPSTRTQLLALSSCSFSLSPRPLERIASPSLFLSQSISVLRATRGASFLLFLVFVCSKEEKTALRVRQNGRMTTLDSTVPIRLF